MSRTGRRGRPPGRPRPVDERYWSVDDALRVYAGMVRWYATGDGVRGTYLAYRTYYDGQWPAALADQPARWALAATTAHDNGQALQHVDPIWCDPAMVSLLAAGADTYPPEPMFEHHLLGPDGIVMFAKPLPVVWLGPRTDTRSTQRISAVTWCTGRSTDDRPIVGVTTWTRWRGPGTFQRSQADHLLSRAAHALVRQRVVRG